MKLNQLSFTSQSIKTNQTSKQKGGIIPALTSCFIPGSGHFLNGNKEDGYFHLSTRLIAQFIYSKIFLDYNKNIKQNLKETGQAACGFAKSFKLAYASALTMFLGMMDALCAYYNKTVFDNKK